MNRKLTLAPIGVIIMLLGSVWFLQGIDILPGSFMTGSSFWAVSGAVTGIVGLVCIVAALKGARNK